MAERTQAMGRSRLVSTTENVAPSDTNGLCFGDVICDRRPDPASEAAKRLDGDGVVVARAKEVVRATAAGEAGKGVALGLGVSAAAVVHIKRRAAAVVLAAWAARGWRRL